MLQKEGINLRCIFLYFFDCSDQRNTDNTYCLSQDILKQVFIILKYVCQHFVVPYLFCSRRFEMFFILFALLSTRRPKKAFILFYICISTSILLCTYASKKKRGRMTWMINKFSYCIALHALELCYFLFFKLYVIFRWFFAY